MPPRSLHDVCVAMRQQLEVFLADEPSSPLLRRVQDQLRVSIRVVDEALTKYRPEEIALSYNGGKDCLVLLIVILACLARQPSPFSKNPATTNNSDSNSNPNGSANPPAFPETFQSVYIVPPHPFAEVDEFVVSSAAEYHLEVVRYSLPMKEGLESYLADRPSIRAVFVGTRRTDPHGEKLTHFDPTDAGWPDFMRVHPVIDWHYAEIWAFIRHLQIPYCPLYDQGYTSLGGTRDTHPNPRLKSKEQNRDGFRPAYELMEDDEERLGRDR
ncbi:phosphoadenosine phosphosulfate reductase [Talaromyces proteolyticus]|uniref:FAD synthase n=1 Tax=Talaromyces proteolyticus TaxID=1131652 RepID=A0AAD4Q159_9EURO|nr:phosphoadenosine phosphosulfate reductase [Talaromyces proteolyticus]KAH8697908.1 phosphoadenosine phosphosulfate reductase [Talaromyces proteolyticus]